MIAALADRTLISITLITQRVCEDLKFGARVVMKKIEHQTSHGMLVEIRRKVAQSKSVVLETTLMME